MLKRGNRAAGGRSVQIAAQLHIAAGLHGRQPFCWSAGSCGHCSPPRYISYSSRKITAGGCPLPARRDDAADLVHQDDAISFGIRTPETPRTVPAAYADSQKASPWYSCSSHRLQRTAVKAEDGAEYHRGQADDRGEAKHRLCIVQLSFRVQLLASRVLQTSSLRHREQKHGLTTVDTSRSVRQRSDQKLMMSSGMSRKFVSMSSMQHRCASQTHQCDRRRTDGIGLRCTQVLTAARQGRGILPDTSCKFQKNVQNSAKFTSALLSGQVPLHTELVLRKIGLNEAVCPSCRTGRPGPIQHFNAVALKPQHLGHVDESRGCTPEIPAGSEAVPAPVQNLPWPALASSVTTHANGSCAVASRSSVSGSLRITCRAMRTSSSGC